MQPLSENALDDIVATERERGAPPLTDWDSLSARLREEGLIRDPLTRRISASPIFRIAAALLLVAGGAAAGRMSSGASPLPVATVASETSATPEQQAGKGSGENGMPVSNATRVAGTEFASPDEAWEVLNRAGEEYQRASAYLSESNTEVPMPASPSAYRTRLAALDNVMSQMRDALREAPQDPVINQYYLATVGAREATLRQMGTVLPASARLNRF